MGLPPRRANQVENRNPRAAPLVLFGAFDRHNLGDMLFPHVAAALLGDREVIFAGLAERDLTPWGGHRTVAISRLAAEWQARYGAAPAHVIHVGGELLTCEAYEAAVMLLSPEQARTAIARYDADRAAGMAWAQRCLGIRHRAAYVLPKGLFRHPGKFIFNGVGGVDLDRRDPALRDEVAASLRQADHVGVRDRTTRAILAKAGVTTHLVPDPAVLVAELFGRRIAAAGNIGEPAEVRRTFMAGYIAVQFSAEFGDDATLTALAGQLDRVAEQTGMSLVFFRAGAAPWHDETEGYRRVAARMRTRDVRIFASLDIWDIAALIANAAGYCGSSLHGRIVALAFARPRLGIVPAGKEYPEAGKQQAFVAAWEPGEGRSWAAPDGLCEGMRSALKRPAALREGIAKRLGEQCRAAVLAWIDCLPR